MFLISHLQDFSADITTTWRTFILRRDPNHLTMEKCLLNNFLSYKSPSNIIFERININNHFSVTSENIPLTWKTQKRRATNADKKATTITHIRKCPENSNPNSWVFEVHRAKNIDIRWKLNIPNVEWSRYWFIHYFLRTKLNGKLSNSGFFV